MPRPKQARRLKLEAFWRAHLKGWRNSDLNHLNMQLPKDAKYRANATA